MYGEANNGGEVIAFADDMATLITETEQYIDDNGLDIGDYNLESFVDFGSIVSSSFN